jgi:hypothetical protein
VKTLPLHGPVFPSLAPAQKEVSDMIFVILVGSSVVKNFQVVYSTL